MSIFGDNEHHINAIINDIHKGKTKHIQSLIVHGDDQLLTALFKLIELIKESNLHARWGNEFDREKDIVNYHGHKKVPFEEKKKLLKNSAQSGKGFGSLLNAIGKSYIKVQFQRVTQPLK